MRLQLLKEFRERDDGDPLDIDICRSVLGFLTGMLCGTIELVPVVLMCVLKFIPGVLIAYYRFWKWWWGEMDKTVWVGCCICFVGHFSFGTEHCVTDFNRCSDQRPDFAVYGRWFGAGCRWEFLLLLCRGCCRYLPAQISCRWDPSELGDSHVYRQIVECSDILLW